jgi:hypothetical protein
MSTKTISTLVAAILVIASFYAVSQTTPKGNKPAKEEVQQSKYNGPEIEFTRTVHDYGTIFQDANGECEFEFKNVGSEPLVLSNVRSSCGCTVPSWPKEPVMPGKTAIIKVKYNTGRVGPINKTVTVESNAVEKPKVELRIQGQVKPKQEEALPDKQQSPMQTN